MDESLEKVFDRANKASGVVIAKAKSIGGLPFTVFTKLYNSCIIPILGYTAHIWAFKPSSFATKIQNGALRFFFGLGKAAPIAALLGDSGWYPIEMQLQFILLKYWYHLCSLGADRIPRKVFGN